MNEPFTHELTVAIEAVRQAMTVCQSVQQSLVTADTLTKRDKSPVTVADFAAQAIICSALAQAFPQDMVVGEEAAGELRQGDQRPVREAVVQAARSVLGGHVSEADVLAAIDHGGGDGSAKRYWTLDPIDGTKGFLRGGQYAVALALIVDHRVVLGVLGCPNIDFAGGKGAIFRAVRGHGAHGNVATATTAHVPGRTDEAWVPVSVDDLRLAAHARFCESVESGHSDRTLATKIGEALGITRRPLHMDSQVKYAAVAHGEASIYLRIPTRSGYEEKIWDHAAGMIVVEEAGGKVTDIDGKPLDFAHGRTLKANRGIVASNGHLHGEVLNAIAASTTQ